MHTVVDGSEPTVCAKSIIKNVASFDRSRRVMIRSDTLKIKLSDKKLVINLDGDD